MGRLISSIIASIIMMALMYIPLPVSVHTHMPNIMMTIATVTVLGPGMHFFICAYESIKNRIVTMDVLISIGVLSAYMYGNFASQGFFDVSDHTFYMTAVMLVTFSHIGEYMDERVKKRAEQVLRNSMMLNSAWTGEKEYMYYVHFQRLIDRVSHISVLVAVGLSLVTFICWYFFLYRFDGEHPFLWALKMSIGVLIIACPCSLCWVTPTATMVASRKGLNHSIVVKNSNTFEKIARLNAVVFDINGLRQDVQNAILHLKGMNMKVVIMTEDRELAKKFAVSGTGADECYSVISPDEKREIIEGFHRQGMKVGIVSNSASVISSLTQSDVEIVLDAVTDITKGYGDIILVKNDPMDVVKTIQLGRRTMSKIKQNVFWAFLFNALGIPVAAGALYPIFGTSLKSGHVEFAMILSSTLVVVNSIGLRFPPFLKRNHDITIY